MKTSKSGAGGTAMGLISQTSSEILSGPLESARGSACRCRCRPARTSKQSAHGCRPSKVLDTAVRMESCFENSTSILPQANDCSASQWPPFKMTMATRHKLQPLARNQTLIRFQFRRFYQHNVFLAIGEIPKCSQMHLRVRRPAGRAVLMFDCPAERGAV